MNKFAKIGCGGLVVFFIIAIILGQIAEKQDGPRQSIKLLNTSTGLKSVTFEMIEENGELTNTWYVDEEVEAGDWIIKRIPEGNYLIKVWDDEESLHNETEYAFKLPDPDKSNFNLYRFDLAMDKNFAVVNMNVLYEGNSFAEHMSQAVGTNQSYLEVADLYSGQNPFLISETYTNRTLIDFDEDLPSEIKYGEILYCLIPLNDDLEGESLYQEVVDQVMSK